MEILFNSEDIHFKLKSSTQHIAWLIAVADKHACQIQALSYIFCSDQYLLRVNQAYLNHDTLTDIISFDQSESEHQIEGDIFISITRVIENASTYDVSTEQELRRVMAHGLLHFIGFNDKSETEQNEMTKAEDAALVLWEKMQSGDESTNSIDHL